MNYTNVNDFTFVRTITDPKTRHLLGTVYAAKNGSLVFVDNKGMIVDFPENFNNGVIKQENGAISINVGGKWLPCNKEDVTKFVNSEMGYVSNSKTIISSKPMQMGE